MKTKFLKLPTNRKFCELSYSRKSYQRIYMPWTGIEFRPNQYLIPPLHYAKI